MSEDNTNIYVIRNGFIGAFLGYLGGIASLIIWGSFLLESRGASFATVVGMFVGVSSSVIFSKSKNSISSLIAGTIITIAVSSMIISFFSIYAIIFTLVGALASTVGIIVGVIFIKIINAINTSIPSTINCDNIGEIIGKSKNAISSLMAGTATGAIAGPIFSGGYLEGAAIGVITSTFVCVVLAIKSSIQAKKNMHA